MLTMTVPAPDTLENPVTVKTPFENVVPSAVPFSNATDFAVKPLPPIVVVKMPNGNCPFEPTLLMTGVGGISVTVAVAVPLGPVAVTASVPVGDMIVGAVYRPAGVIVPYVAAKPVAPVDVNCCVAPRFSETVSGAMDCGFSTCSVTAADADPPGPFAVTVTELEGGMTAGAVYRPLALMLPAVAVQVVAPAEVNC